MQVKLKLHHFSRNVFLESLRHPRIREISFNLILIGKITENYEKLTPELASVKVRVEYTLFLAMPPFTFVFLFKKRFFTIFFCTKRKFSGFQGPTLPLPGLHLR